MLLNCNDDSIIKRTKVAGHYKTDGRGKQVYVSPHYRVLRRREMQPAVTIQKPSLIKLAK